jgi:hypothetical protein
LGDLEIKLALIAENAMPNLTTKWDFLVADLKHLLAKPSVLTA